MPFKIAPTSVHEITKDALVTPAKLTLFGKLLLSCCLEDKEVFTLCSLCVNYDVTAANYSDRSDFLDYTDGMVFSAMQAFLATYHEGNPWPKSRLDWVYAIKPHLELCRSQQPEMSLALQNATIATVLSAGPARSGDFDRLCDGLIDYITGVRFHQLELTHRTSDPAKRRTDFEAVPRSIRIPGASAEAVDNEQLLASIFNSLTCFSPIYSGVAKFDTAYGNRMMPGDAWLGAACPGGGKTNFVCQLAGFTAHNGKQVMIITTEVEPATMMLRAYSAVSGVKYKLLRGMSGSRGDHAQAAEFIRWVREGPGRNIRIFRYRDVPGNDFNEKLARMAESYFRMTARMPDLTLLDWIGKAADSGFTTPWEKREGYSRIGIRMADFADETASVTVAMAQADPGTKNRTNISDMETADCKSLSQPFEGMIHLTSLCDKSEGEEDKDVHRECQYWVIAKCREEAAQRLSVRRDFSYMRFADV